MAKRAGITESNLSTIEHARREPRSTTIDRLAAALDVTLIPVATSGRNTVAEAGEHIAQALAAGDPPQAYRAALQLANDLGTSTPYLRLLLAAEPPAPVAPGWDALLAALTEWRLQQAGLPSPDWVRDSGDAVTTSWEPPGAVLPARPSRIPDALRRRGVLIEEDELTSA